MPRGKQLGPVMKITFAIASAVLILSAGAASAQRGDPIPMRDGSTIVMVGGGCLVQYGGRGQRINNANRCNDDDMRRADQIMSGGGGGLGGGANIFGGGAGGGLGGAPPRGGRAGGGF